MAWKMVRTIFPRHSVSANDRNLLLMFVSIVSLEDLKSTGALKWKKPPPEKSVLSFDRDSVLLKTAERFPLFLKQNYTAAETDGALDSAEEILDRYDMSEVERATLFTALPCLALHALEEYITWKQEPPFVELG